MQILFPGENFWFLEYLEFWRVIVLPGNATELYKMVTLLHLRSIIVLLVCLTYLIIFKSMELNELRKPQLDFEDSVDNSHNYSRRELLVKPNAIVDIRSSPKDHPYRPEIEAFTFEQALYANLNE